MSTKLNTELHDHFITYAVTFRLQDHPVAIQCDIVSCHFAAAAAASGLHYCLGAPYLISQTC